MKKVLASLLIGVSLISLTPTTNAGFKDLAFGHKNAQAIEFLQDAEVIGGYSDGTYKPGNTVNRAELAKILVEAQGITPDADQYNNCFPDVTDEWFAPYVCYAKEMGWVSGYADGNFRPEQTVNKVEAIKMVINSQGFENEMAECNEEVYADIDTNAWYAKFICVAVAKGLLEEDEDGNYVPAEGMTRGNVAENIYRSIMVRKLNRNAFNDEIRGQVEEVKAEFKADREAVRNALKAAKDDLIQMREDGATQDEIKATREGFWEDVKEAHKESRENFAGQMKGIHEDFQGEKERLRSRFQDCKEDGMVYRVHSDSCVERMFLGGDDGDNDDDDDDDDDDTGTGSNADDDDDTGTGSTTDDDTGTGSTS